MDSELDRTHPLDGEWDEQTCREFEQWLDEVEDERRAQEIEDEGPPCECYYVDADAVESHYCPAHGRFWMAIVLERNRFGRELLWQCTECGQPFNLGWGDYCNACIAKQERHRKLINAIKSAQESDGDLDG